MDKKKILTFVDHTLLKQTATFDDIKIICDDGIKYDTASVCIAPCFVKKAKEYVGDKIKICTVIVFPKCYNTPNAKLTETEEALTNGADEIDMVINLGDVKSCRYDNISAEIKALKMMCANKILKVIIETCLLTEEEKINMCKVVSESGADYIKTSTGFSSGGATLEDIKLFSENVEKHVKIKAAGGISSFEDAEKFIKFGANRLGTSRLVKIMKECEK